MRLRNAHPDCLDAYLEPGNILVSFRRFGEADQLLGDAVIRFPDGPAASVAYAMSAHHQRDWTEVPRITVDWDTSQADDFRTRCVPWTMKQTSLAGGRATRSDRKSLA